MAKKKTSNETELHVTRQDELAGGMLYKMSIDKFKSFGNRQDIPLRRINLIFGPNSSGKSSIIQSLLYLHTLENKPGRQYMLDVYSTLLGDDMVDLGGFGQYIFKRDVSNKLQFSFTFANTSFDTEVVLQIYFDHKIKQLNSNIKIYVIEKLTSKKHIIFETFGFKEKNLPKTDNISKNIRKRLTVSYSFSLCQILVDKISLNDEKIDYENVFKHKIFEDFFNKEYEIVVKDTSILLSPNVIFDFLSTFFKDKAKNIGEILKNNTVNKEEQIEMDSNDIVDVEIVKKFLTKFLTELSNIMLNLLYLNVFISSLRYLGPIRPYPSRDLSEVAFNEPWSNRSKDVDVWGRFVSHPTQFQKINAWLGKLKTPYRLVPERVLRELTIKLNNDDKYLTMTVEDLLKDERNFNSIPRLLDVRTQTYVTHRDVGIGISQILPVLVYAYSGSGKTICIEQPELHLHPRLQADLADVFIETSKEENNGHRYILETHSESLIERIFTAIYNRELSPDDVSILYVDPVLNGNGSMVREIRISEKGELLDEWPDGFFDEARKERRKRY
jgi:AAA15 family ATPase/GTPase